MNVDRVLKAVVIVYAIGIVLSFGPATVQSERAGEAYRATCKAERLNNLEWMKWCDVGGPSKTDGLPKAFFWPLWLSYTVANS